MRIFFIFDPSTLYMDMARDDSFSIFVSLPYGFDDDDGDGVASR
jgi:hypothetical protein